MLIPSVINYNLSVNPYKHCSCSVRLWTDELIMKMM